MDALPKKPAGPLLKQIRELKGLAAKEVAEAIGVAPSYLSEIETGKRNTTPAMIRRMAPVLGWEPDALIQEVAAVTARQEVESSVMREPEALYRFTRETDPLRRAAADHAIHRAEHFQEIGLDDQLDLALLEIRTRLSQIHLASNQRFRKLLLEQAKARIDEFDGWVTAHLLTDSPSS